MIQREWQIVDVITYVEGKDEYGQLRQLGSSSRPVKMVVKLYTNANVADIRFNNVTDIGLTEDFTITDHNSIKIGDDIFDILYTIPSKKYLQVLMRKK